MIEEINATVRESYTRDVGRGICRIDYDTMDKLEISTGDVIQIKGKRITHAKALPLYPSDENKKMIRIDGLIRENSNAKIGELVKIKPIKTILAITVDVKALEANPPIDERYLSDALEAVSIVVGDKVMIPFFGGKISFVVIKTNPEGPVMITQKTVFTIQEVEPAKDSVMIVQIIDKLDKKKQQIAEKMRKLLEEKDMDRMIDELVKCENEMNRLEIAKRLTRKYGVTNE